MTLIDRAITAIRKLPVPEQEALALELPERLSGDTSSAAVGNSVEAITADWDTEIAAHMAATDRVEIALFDADGVLREARAPLGRS